MAPNVFFAKGLSQGSKEVPARWGGYLANISATEFLESYQAALPETIDGSEFKAQYGSHYDGVTAIDDSRRCVC